MKALFVLLLAAMMLVPLANAKPQVQVSGTIYGVPSDVLMGPIVFTDYYRGNSVTGWNNQTSYSVTLDAHEYYTTYADFSAVNGTSGECLGSPLGKFSNFGPFEARLFMFCYQE